MPDVPASTSSTITIPVGGSPPAGYDSIETAYDYDWYRASLTGGVTYTIRVVGLGTGDRTLGDPMIDGIYNGSGNYVSGFNNDGLISGPNGRDAMVTFRPVTAGANNYWIAVSGDLGTIGTYTISVTNSSGGTDNVWADTSTPGTITVGGAAVIGTIDNETDADWYKVALTSGTTYTIRMRGLTSGFGTLPDPVIAGVYDSNGNYIPHTYVDDIDTRDAALTFVAPSTGNFFIAAEGWRARTGYYYSNTPFVGTYYTGTFTLDIAVATADVRGDTSTTATLTIGSNTNVLIGQPYDHDWYAVTLTAGRTYEFSLSGTGVNNTPGIHGIFTSAGVYAGGYAAPVLGAGTAAATTIFTPDTSGTYYVDAFSLYEGSYNLSASQIADDVPGNKTSTATVAVNGSVSGHIGGATDIDWYGINLVADTPYIVKIEGKQSNMGTLEDPLIAGIYDANGLLVSSTFSDDSNGNEPSLVFRPATSGKYFIAADGYAGYTGTYKLSVTQLAGDVGQTPETAATLALNSPVTVTIDDASDSDWYKVTLTAGTTYGIRLNGAPTNRGTLADPILTGLFNSAGVYVPDTFVDDTGSSLNAKMFYTPTTTGTYYVAADGYDRFTGTMRLAVTFDSIGDTNPTAGTLTVGIPVEGTIDTAVDIDRYGVTLLASTTYYFRMQGLQSGNGDLVDPDISAFLNSGGSTPSQGFTPINDATIGNDAWIKFTTDAAGAGTYYLVLDGNGAEGEFLLSAVVDIANTTSTNQSIALNGSNGSTIDDGTDADWFSMTLTTGKTYVVQMLALDTGNGTLTDPYINGVRSGSSSTAITGTTVNDVAGLGRDASVRFVAGSTATHYVAAQSNGGAVGTYIVTLREDAGESITTAWTTLSIGGFVDGRIDDGPDADWYKIYLNNNTSYIFKMLGVDSGLGTLDDPTLAIHNSSGTGTTTNRVLSASGMDAIMRFYTTTAGDFYINAQGGGSDYGTFRLTAETEPGPTNGTSHAITLGNAKVGTLDDTSDMDRYSISLNAGTQYRIRMSGVDGGGGTLADPLINGIRFGSTLQGSTTVEGGGTGRDVMFSFTPANTGVHYIDADTASATLIGTYTLTVSLW